jgi:hypothetical protein
MSRNRLLLGGLSLALAMCTVHASEAGFFLDSFSGNSQFLNPFDIPNAGSDGIVNFAVYQRAVGDADWTDDFGGAVDAAIGGSVDADASFVYMYQVVNTNPNPLDESILKTLDIFLPAGLATSVTSTGLVGGFVFDDPSVLGGPTGPTTNARLGNLADVTPFPDDFPANGAPSETLAPPGLADAAPFAADAGALPAGATSVGAFTLQFTFSIPFTPPAIPLVSPLSYSSVMFFTSDRSPVYLAQHLNDGGDTTADIPSAFGPLTAIPTPEPTTIAMTLGAIAVGLVAAFAGSRKSAAAE